MKWVKRGHIFKPTGEFEWSREYAQVPTPIELEDRVRIYYATRPWPVDGQFVSNISFVDVEKDDPSKVMYMHDKSVLPLGTIGQFDAFGVMPGCLIRDQGRLLMYYTGWSRRTDIPYSTSIGVAESMDEGVSFQRIVRGPVLSINENDPYLVNGPCVRRTPCGDWLMWYSSAYAFIVDSKRMDPIYKIKMATSKDGIHWVSGSTFIIPEHIEGEAQNAPWVISHEGGYLLAYCYRHGTGFRDQGRGYRLACAKSFDLVNWKLEELSMNSLDSAWDSEMQAYPRLFERDGRLLLFYNGNAFGKLGFGYAEFSRER